MMYNDKIGDRYIIDMVDGQEIEVEAMEISSEGRACKYKAVNPDPKLGKIGFFMEGEDWVTFDLDILKLHN